MTSLPTNMKAWQQLLNSHHLTEQTVPVPQPKPDEVLVKILAAGICHTDCSLLALPPAGVPGLPGKPATGQPVTLGHEACGLIVKLGDNVQDDKLKLGKRVTIMCIPGCNQKTCTECNAGLQRLCPIQGLQGYSYDGCFADYMTTKFWACVPVPDDVSNEAAAIAGDALLTSYHAVYRAAKVKPGHTVIICGLGGLGMNALQLVRYIGVKRVIIMDKKKAAVEEAIKYGVPAKDALSSLAEVEKLVKEEKLVVDSVLDFVSSTETATSAQKTVRIGGRIAVVGVDLNQMMPQDPIMLRALKIIGVYNGLKKDLEICLDLLAQGVLKPHISLGSLADVNKALDDLHNGHIVGRRVLVP
eukprot:TRINITY_DN10190_c0_g1_i1.p1 TRINITY_DN10190_c0_g1~~TRINITY_DN10190_c0_g1_i1.p1  ORF type:complete len:357 (+),score=62.05 TRINITY_DN10190_c0_g1_i1:111-1181(+)